MTVGQDLVRMESGGAPASKEEASSEAKEPASKEQSTSSDPKPEKKDEPAPKKEEKSASAPPKEEKKAPAPAPKKSESQSEGSSAPTMGNREERRVSNNFDSPTLTVLRVFIGQDEPYAPENR